MTRLSVFLTTCAFLFFPALNNGSLAQLAVEFSHERGFYYDGFKLTISANTDDCIIKYTFDGSDPGTSAIAQIHTPPAELFIDPYVSAGRAVTPGFIVRACAIRGADTSRVETHSYIFPSEIKYQSETSPELAPYWPTQTMVPNTFPENLVNWMQSYYQEMYLRVNPHVVHKPEYYGIFEDAMMDIPTFSLVTDPYNLFDDSAGIFINATWSGREWERPGSVELIDPAEDGFQVNTGIRIRGGWSCRGDNPKHAFRLFFRKEYGDPKLHYPLFADYGADEFDKIDLRSEQNNSWHIPGGNAGADFIRDLYAREIQSDLGQPYSRSEYYHLFLNGKYWGLFQTQERPDANYAETYFGGDKDDYDVVKSSGPSYDYPQYCLEATDGYLDSSRDLWMIAKEGFTDENYNMARGMNADGSPNAAFPVLLDEVNLIDYIIIIYFIANHDGPASLSSSDTRINNFFGIYNRVNPHGFKYFLHDSESSMYSADDNITGITVAAGEEFRSFNPMWLHQQLLENSEYRQTFADRAYKHLYNSGALSAGSNIGRYVELKNKIDQAIIGESARWGWVRSGVPYTKINTWDVAVRGFTDGYFPLRTNVVIGQFSNAGWLNGILPPDLDESEFEIGSEGDFLISGDNFSLTNPNSTGGIYYTLNGNDPRSTGGEVSAEAIAYTDVIDVSKTAFLKSRVKDGDNWSPLAEQVILTHRGNGLLISEINYAPAEKISGEDTLGSKSLEFIELKNYAGTNLDISAFHLGEGINYTFPLNVFIEKDSLVVIASDTAAFRKLFGFKAYGPFKGSLNNAGEQISLINAGGRTLIETEYNTNGVWYYAADGAGYTLVYADYDLAQAGAGKSAWRASTNLLGSPGKDDPQPSSYEIEITEVLANSGYPFRDAIEIYNRGDSDQDIGNWYLSDGKNTPGKWQIPAGTLIPAGSYLVFYEGHYVTDTLQFDSHEFGSEFSVSSAGERIYLFSGNASGNVLEHVDDFDLEATGSNISFGNYTSVSGNNHNVQLAELYLGNANTEAWKSPVIFKSIMYHPAGNNFEYLILKNRSDSVINFYHASDSAVTWEVDGIGFRFPVKTSLAAGDSLYLVEKIIPAGEFRQIMNLPGSTQVYNYPGKLKNSSEKLSIQSPILITGDTSFYAWVRFETLEYSDRYPWPVTADGDGYALYRINEEAFADDAANWTTVLDVLPDADAGDNRRVRIGRSISLDASGSSDPGDQTLTYEWQLISRPAGSAASLSGNTSVSPGFTPDEEGGYLFSLQVDNGTRKSALSYVALRADENFAPVAGLRRTSYSLILGETLYAVADECYDPDYDELAYEWELNEVPDGSSYLSEVYTDRTLEFTPDVTGTFKFGLTVNDGELYSNTYNVRVYVSSPALSDPAILSNRTLVYPNPVTEILNIDFSLQQASELQVSFTTPEGRTVYQKQFKTLQPGLNQIHIDLGNNHVLPGIYLVRIESEEFTEIEKVIYIP